MCLHRFIVRIMCSVLGLHVRQKNPRSRDKNTKLYICNHVTEFDHNVINLLTPCNTVSTYFLYVRHLKHVSNEHYYITVNKVLIVYNQQSQYITEGTYSGL